MKTKNIFILAIATLFNISAFAQINVVDDNYKLSSGYNETTEMEKIDIYKYLKTQDVWINIEHPYSNVVGEKIYVYEVPQHIIDERKQAQQWRLDVINSQIEKLKQKLSVSSDKRYWENKIKEALTEKSKIIEESDDTGHNKYPCLNRKEETFKAKSMLPGYYTIVSILLTEEDFNRHKEEAFAMKVNPSDTLYLKNYFDISRWRTSKGIQESIYLHDIEVKKNEEAGRTSTTFKGYSPYYSSDAGPWGLILENENGEQYYVMSTRRSRSGSVTYRENDSYSDVLLHYKLPEYLTMSYYNYLINTFKDKELLLVSDADYLRDALSGELITKPICNYEYIKSSEQTIGGNKYYSKAINPDNKYCTVKDIILKGRDLFYIIDFEGQQFSVKDKTKLPYSIPSNQIDYTSKPIDGGRLVLKSDLEKYVAAYNKKEQERQLSEEARQRQEAEERAASAAAYKKEAAKHKQELLAKYPADIVEKILNHKVQIGMTMEMCREAWGYPYGGKTSITNSLGTAETWFYGSSSLTFVNGKLGSIIKY